jgi:hypothetical protein
MGGQFVIFAGAAPLPRRARRDAHALTPEAARDKVQNAPRNIIQQTDYAAIFPLSQRRPQAFAAITRNAWRVLRNFSRAQHA